MTQPLLELSENTRIALVGLCALGIVVLAETRPWNSAEQEQLEQLMRDGIVVNYSASVLPPPPELLVDQAMEDSLREETRVSIRELDPSLDVLMANREWGVLIDRLLRMASEAMADKEVERLAEILSLLGQVAIEQQALDVAEVYLFEALDLLRDGDDEAARADVYMQLGRTHLRSREIARSAGYAYDALQIGRNQLFRRQPVLAEQNIRNAIQHSLSINRFNAAASGLSTLALLHTKNGQQYEAQEARLEAARLFSSSGQSGAARSEVQLLRDSGIEEWRLSGIEEEIQANLLAYEESIAQIGIARDYQRLYHYYLSEGNHSQAWHFRLLASQSLENISKRAMFHRQQGVLALLYNSNEAMAKAHLYFDQASEAFRTTGMEEQNTQTLALKEKVF